MKATRLFVASVAALSLAACGGGTEYAAVLSGAAEVPAVTNTTASGNATVTVDGKSIKVEGTFKDLSGNASQAHIHGPASTTETAPIFCNLSAPTSPNGDIGEGEGANSCGDRELTDAEVADFENGRMYINIHTAANPNGEIRGQIIKKD